MKKPIVLIILGLLAVALTVGFANKPQETSKKYLVMRKSEAAMGSGSIAIRFPDGQIDVSEMPKLNKSLDAVSTKINEVSAMGYQLVSTVQINEYIVDYIFEKK